MRESEIIIITILFYIILGVFILGIVVFIRQYLKRKKTYLSQIKQMDEEHKRELLETQVEIQSQTMKHIGREIHDSVGQKLTLASLYAQQLIFEERVPKAFTEVNEIGEIINESLSELRQLSKSLTSDTLENHSLVELIERECELINQLKECEVHFEHTLKTKVTSYHIKSILFRVTQEFLQNSIKHSRCKNISIALSKDEKKIQLRLEDDGKGFDIDKLKAKGIGLKNMEKRTQMLGGEFFLESQINKGTKLTVKIPL
ncbi:histidine kinase/DNA gyrase B/HSP90-like ATPase [Aquimarina sp. MAR_2010_214]|uniref:sensor histidine kinase n=1 Tax=Aquimarina sp. MAR_2010_214 TaxID=1250026 RepID=UPI000C7040BA|nr:sensor histidine kinase [Aquimarina sp. MAR_2010_214]PKV50790.1 histidine kinase/DNA gyrase B/HSP90-like ATPase [Aquimarina sp. MAR_2010_214]